MLAGLYLDPALEGFLISTAGSDHAEAVAGVQDVEGVKLVPLEALAFNYHALHVDSA